MKAIAIDDDPIALEIISACCQRRGDIQLETFTSPRMGMQYIAERKPDIVFIDVEMNGTSGLTMARQVPPACCLIFVTANARYALDGYEMDAVDFLHKPYLYDRFNRAVQKACQRLRMRDLLHAAESAGRQLTLKSEYRNVSVPVSNILYVEAVANYVKVHLADGSGLLSKITLCQVERQLLSESFVRIHRSYLVAICRVERFTRTGVTLVHSGKTLPIGRTYAARVLYSLKNKDVFFRHFANIV